MICTLAALASRSFIPGYKEQPDEHSSAPRPRNTLYIVVPAWLIAGLGVTVVALLLMAIKTGLHGHGTPDYTPEQMVRVLSLTPLWVIVGLMIGLVALFWKK